LSGQINLNKIINICSASMTDLDLKNKNLIENSFKKLFRALKSNNEDEFTDI